MAENSKIEWCDHTFNPWIGCTKVSPGCANCYAESMMDKRLGKVSWGKGNPRQRTSIANWNLPLNWNRKAESNYLRWKERTSVTGIPAPARPRVFCASLADVFDPEVPNQWRDDLFELVYKCKNLDWLILTKRPELMADYFLGSSGAGANAFDIGIWDNLWLGTSVENQQEAGERIPALLEIPAKVRFLSCEPLLEGVSLRWLAAWQKNQYSAMNPDSKDGSTNHLDGLREINWVICGGESGTNARPMHPDWARTLRDQCVEAGVPFFFKQWGEWWPSGKRIVERKRMISYGNEPMYKTGKSFSGRLLDGREWNEFPKVEGVE